MKDKNGSNVKVGDLVKVLALPIGLIESLPDEEKPLTQSMLGGNFTIESIEYIPNFNKIVVSKWQNDGDGYSSCSSLYLSSNDFELIES